MAIASCSIGPHATSCALWWRYTTFHRIETSEGVDGGELPTSVCGSGTEPYRRIQLLMCTAVHQELPENGFILDQLIGVLMCEGGTNAGPLFVCEELPCMRQLSEP